jgi:predicted Ser/Thr protein kinase
MGESGKEDPGALPPVPELPAGAEVGGYRVLSELGRGAMGVVYRAEDLGRGGTVALKTLIWGEPAAMLRFKQEFRAIADITHENLATLYELVSVADRLFFTMELVEGVNFAEWVQKDQDRLRPALRQLAEGLLALHEAGVIHRDLKPSNVRVTPEGRVVVLDFGLAAPLGPGGAHKSSEDHAAGTPAYMAPEQAMGKPVTPACDWYSVGVMLYEALTECLPFEGTGIEVMIAKQRKPPPPPSKLADRVPEDLESLCTALLRREPELRPSGEEVLLRLRAEASATVAERRADSAPILVGREEHLESLRRAFEALRERRPVMVLVHGYSGMGKTTLVRRFEEELGSRDDVVILKGKCYERESVPYKVLDSPIDALARYLDALPRAEAEALLPRDVHSAARVFPVLRKVEAIAKAPPPAVEIPDPQELRRRAFAGLREIFARISDRGPLVLCVDDLQWGDADSADLLTSLLRPPEAPAFLFVGCYRREDADVSPFLLSLRQPGRGLPRAREILVDPLSEDDANALARSLVGGTGVRADRAAVIARESGGSPFFLRELAAFRESVAGAGGVTLEDVLRQRIRTLPEGAAALLEVVAVAGGPLPPATAASGAGLRNGAPASMTAALRGARLVRMTSPETGEELDTYHDRVRETVLAGLPGERLRELHRRLGSVLEADPEVDPEVLALHFEGAGDAARAGEHYVRAAEDAHRALAFDHAARLFGKALEMLSPAGEKRRELLRRRADALADGGRGSEAGEVYLQAAEGASGVTSLELRSRAAQVFLGAGKLDEWQTVIGSVQRELGILLPKSSFRALLRILRQFVWIRLRGFKFRERDPETIPKEAILRLENCYSLSGVLSQIDVLQGFQYHTLAVRLAVKLGHPLHVALCASRHLAYENALHIRDTRRVEKLRKVAERLVENTGAIVARAFLDLCVGGTQFLRGKWRAAAEPLFAAGRSFREECAGYWWERNFCEFWWLMCLDFLGEFHELDRAVPGYLRDAEDRGNRYMETDLRTRIIPWCALMRDEPGEARAGVDDAMANWPEQVWSLQRYRWMDSRMSIALYHGDLEGGREILAQDWGGFQRAFMRRVRKVNNVMVFGRDRLLLAEAAESRERGRPRGRQGNLSRLGQDFVGKGEGYSEGWRQLLMAGAANLSGDVAAAVRHLETAEEMFVTAEMAAYLAAARRQRGRLIGGDEGRELVAEADGWLRGQGIRNPHAWARMYVPGFED